jgi:hypothetical protein
VQIGGRRERVIEIWAVPEFAVGKSCRKMGPTTILCSCPRESQWTQRNAWQADDEHRECSTVASTVSKILRSSITRKWPFDDRASLVPGTVFVLVVLLDENSLWCSSCTVQSYTTSTSCGNSLSNQLFSFSLALFRKLSYVAHVLHNMWEHKY